jgi:pimeloyl-ACP methyl ester carboxylesterase
MVVAPDMLGYGHAHPPSEVWNLDEETEHLKRSLEPVHGEPIHLVAHSLGTTFGLYLLRALGPRVARMTLIDPVVVSVLRDTGEDDGYAEMEEQYQRFMGLLPDPAAAARAFVEQGLASPRQSGSCRTAPTSASRVAARASSTLPSRRSAGTSPPSRATFRSSLTSIGCMRR